VSYRSDSLSENFSLKEAVMGALRDRMIEEMKLRNFSAATQKTYVYAATRLAKYYRTAHCQTGTLMWVSDLAVSPPWDSS
jgi:phosphopantetheinyl transferase (holo-ACP synthase)